MDLLDWFNSTKLLISGKFKYFHYNSSTSSLEILDGHFLNGIEFDCNTTSDKVCLLKINNFELKYNKINGKITTSKEVVGSYVILEPCDNISFHLKHSDGYFDEELKLVEREKAVKLQALWMCEADKLNYPSPILPSHNENSEDSNNLLSIEGLPIVPDSQEFQIILDGNSCDYASQFEGEFYFSNDTYNEGDTFKLVTVNNKLTLYNPLYGYLGRGLNEHDSKCIMYYKEIPNNLAYLEKYEDNGMYLMRCGDDKDKEDDYLTIFWVKASCGFSEFRKKREEASIFQFAIYDGYTNEKATQYNNSTSKL
jgi:hypothetical protein